MATYIKVAGELYPAEINGSMADYTWDGRESKSITLTMSHDKAAALLPGRHAVEHCTAHACAGRERHGERKRVGQQRILALG